MAEISTAKTLPKRKVQYNGRGKQMMVYLGKQVRLFINQSDWKVLPMAGIIAALVAVVIRKRFFINMEGSLIGGFALACVAIWNGCFNSIQSVCRERPIIKREHRSGLHILSYVGAHMIFQFLLCLVQTALTMYVMKTVGVQFPDSGFITPWMIVDIGISMLLISYAADMMSLFMSSITHTTTGAMTLMPFVLIFQLIFSGGIIPLPAWSQKLSGFTISNYGIRAIASQSGYNELPMVTPWNTVISLKKTEIGGSVTLGEIMEYLDNPVVEKYRDREIVKSYTVGEVSRIISDADQYLKLRDKKITESFTLRDVAELIMNSSLAKPIRDYELVSASGHSQALTVGAVLAELAQDDELMNIQLGKTITLGDVLDKLHAQELVDSISDVQVNEPVALGRIVDVIRNNESLRARKDRTFTLKTTVGDLLDVFGEENVKELIESKTAAAAHKDEYEKSVGNVAGNWIMLFLFTLLFACMSVIALKLIDKDKR